jgi:choline dehydrogenase-like flavoprotein
MNLLKAKKNLIIMAGILVFVTILGYRHYFDKNKQLEDLYNLHRSMIQIYMAPDFLEEDQMDQLIVQSWKNLKKQPAFIKDLSKVLEALPLSFQIQSKEEKKGTLLALHQSYFLKVRQAILVARRIYINLIYASERTNPYAQYDPDPPYYGKGEDLSFYQSNLELKDNQIIHKVGEVDYLIIGSGPAGSLIAHELVRKLNNSRVVLIDQGPFIRPQSMRTDQKSEFMESGGHRTTYDKSILIKNGQVIGGGTTVNIDLAFSPLLPFIRNRLERWVKKGWVDPSIIGKENNWKGLKTAYNCVEKKVKTRKVGPQEINKNNALLKSSMSTATTYDLNQRVPQNKEKILKMSAVDGFIIPALKGGKDFIGKLDIIPSAKVDHILFEGAGVLKKAKGVALTFESPHPNPNVVRDINGFKAKPGQKAVINARNVIICAGTLGSAAILLRSDIMNPNIGEGIVLHPSMPVVGLFDHKINVMDGLYASVYAPSVNPEDQYFFEAMGDEPSVIAQIIPGFGKEIGEFIKKFSYLGGFGVMLIDSVSNNNHIAIDPLTEKIQVRYELTENDKKRFRKALKKAIEILFDQGAKKVFIPSLEPINKGNLPIFDQHDNYAEAIDALEFKPAANMISSAHMQGSNKMGNNPTKSVVDQKFKVWDPEISRQFNNLYVVDSSIFPESIGANPMQAIYTFAKLFIFTITNKPAV